LFEKHKLFFSLILTVKILQAEKKFDDLEWRYFLTGPTGEIEVKDNPTTWVS